MKKSSRVNTIAWILTPFITIISFMYILSENIPTNLAIIILIIPYIMNICYFVYSKVKFNI
ncbi:hypothetical protein [Bacillus cereus]|uniref:hypothetical protein n=1 Tax=Bacillus cereus TaxID=1396 RepID=UPI0009530681|nr:hypothetical protein [Bacillus cereus]OLR24747.1 hypothetical protein BLD50_15860 [Bacillus cereus]